MPYKKQPTTTPTHTQFVTYTPDSAAVQRNLLGSRPADERLPLFTNRPRPIVIDPDQIIESPTPTLVDDETRAAALEAHQEDLRKRRERYAKRKDKGRRRRPPPSFPVIQPFNGRPLQCSDIYWTRSRAEAEEHAEKRGQRILDLSTITIIHHAFCSQTCHPEWNQEHLILAYLWDFENWATHLYHDIDYDPVLLRGDNPSITQWTICTPP
jgi:hypothetical protein